MDDRKKRMSGKYGLIIGNTQYADPSQLLYKGFISINYHFGP